MIRKGKMIPNLKRVAPEVGVMAGSVLERLDPYFDNLLQKGE
jgi:hypothetical protein